MFRSARFLAVCLALAGFNVLAADNDGSGSSGRAESTPQQPTSPTLRNAAIFVENRAGQKFDNKVTVLEDLLANRLAGRGYTILSRESILNALKQGNINIVSGTPETPGQKLDRILNDNTSAVRLAQGLGVNYIIVPTIMAFAEDKRNYTANGVAINNIIYTLRVSYRLAEGTQGSTVDRDTVIATRTVRQSAGQKVDADDLYNQLLKEASDRLSETLAKRLIPQVQSVSHF